jgi:hypothetical protein
MLRERERSGRKAGTSCSPSSLATRLRAAAVYTRRRGPSTLGLGYWIHPAFTRRGLATTVARLLTDAAFSHSDVDCVEIHHDTAKSRAPVCRRDWASAFVGEAPDEGNAPAAVGIDCTRRMDRDDWQRKR